MKKVYRFYSDPGHGWLAVPLNDLYSVGLTLADISEYSYWRGKTLYLEEDCDAVKFSEFYSKRFGKMFSYIAIHHEKTPIRSYKRISHV